LPHGKWTCTLRIQRTTGRHPRRVAPGPALSGDADGHRGLDASRTAGAGFATGDPGLRRAAADRDDGRAATVADGRGDSLLCRPAADGGRSGRQQPAGALRSGAGPAHAEPRATSSIRLEGLSFGEALAALLQLACAEETRAIVASELFGVWINRGCPVASLQFSSWWQGRRAVISHTYGLAADAAPPAWLDPQRGGVVAPGLFHSVFLPVRKLIEIGLLTTLSDDRSSPMLNKLGHKVAAIAKMAKLAAKTPHGSRWEKLLSALTAVQAWSEQVDSQENRLREVTAFGSNPGELRMYSYVPEGLPASAPLVVVLHGCTQSAASYNKGSGWSTLADRYGFALLLPQQNWNNNPLRCFNWFKPEDNEREKGEPLSIRQMVDRMVADHGLDRRRVYVTGTSSGGAMTTIMLATYPEVFAGGAVLAGVPYRTARGLQEGLESIFQGRSRSAREWGELVRAASPHQGCWPKLSVWHGDADTTVKPVNAEEIIKQWTDLHGLDLQPTVQMTVDGYPRRVWQGPDGDELIESYTVTGMSHGAALDPGAEPHQCGTAAPFFNAVGISSTHRIADFWGLLAERPASAKAPAAAEQAGRSAASAAAAESIGGANRFSGGERVVNDENAADAGQGYASGPQDQRACDQPALRPRRAWHHFGLSGGRRTAEGRAEPSHGQHGAARHRRAGDHFDGAGGSWSTERRRPARWFGGVRRQSEGCWLGRVRLGAAARRPACLPRRLDAPWPRLVR
jgi:poly(hydroxyalkanoate) depolymerase family esterase